FSQAEDGIRDFHVTGVQTCALPIFSLYFRVNLSKIYGEFSKSRPAYGAKDKETVRAKLGGQDEQPGITGRQEVLSGNRQERRERGSLKIGETLEKPAGILLVFFHLQRAGAVDQRAARFDEAGGRQKELPLQVDESF